MEYKIVNKDQFTLIGVSKIFKYEGAATEVPKLWAEYHQTGKSDTVCSVYGVSIDENMGGNEFEYLIADNYNPINEIAEGFVTRVIPKHTWAVFACQGANPHSIQDVQKKIFSEWLPMCKDYEIAAGYNIEMYSNPIEYAKGVHDEKYYCEIWIPVQRK